MRLFKPLNIGTLTKNYVQNGRFWLGVGAAYFFDFKTPNEPLTEQEMWGVVPGELGASAVFDEGRPKVRGEVLVSGRCFAPEGEPVAMSQVSLEMGPARENTTQEEDGEGSIKKSLAVHGDRCWQPRGDLWDPSEPQPFTEMDLKPETSFGGEGCAQNPNGKGHLAPGEKPAPEGTTPLANVQAPGALVASPEEPQEPVGLWPLGLEHPGRLARFGTCDQQWADNVFPEDPRDTDPSFYNMAPPDQQIDGFWRGDEVFVCTNMHPEKPRLTGRICGIQTRCLVKIKEKAWREVPMAMETVWLFPHQERGVVIHRGHTEIGTFVGTDVEHLVLAYELLGGESRPAEAYQEAVEKRLDEKTALAYLARQDDLGPPEKAREQQQAREEAMTVAAAGEKTAAPLPPQMEATLAQARQQARAELDEARSLAASQGVDLDALMEREHQEALERNKKDLDEVLPLLEDIGVTVDLDDFSPDRALEMKGGPKLDLRMPPVDSIADVAPAVAFLKGLQAKLEKLEQKMGPVVERAKDEAQKLQDQEEAGARALAAEVGLDYDQAVAEARAQAAPAAPFAEMQEAGRLAAGDPKLEAEVAAAQAKLEAARGDIERGMALAGGKNPALDPEMGPMLREVLHHAPPPETPPAVAQAAARQRLEAQVAGGQGLSEVDLSGMDLAGIELPGANLVGAVMTGADLSGADLSGADLSGAILAHADLSRANLAGAALAGASLGKANLEAADLSQADMKKAIISGADFSGAKLCGADLTGVKLVQETTLVEADLSDARVPAAYLLECDLSRANLTGADLEKTAFLQSKLEGTDLGEANLTSATMVEVEARGCKLAGASAAHLATALASDFSGADFSGADLSTANFRQAKLAGADFSGAVLDQADFGEADLSGATLREASAKQTRFIGATMVDASLQEANLFGASLMGASLTRADMRGVQLHDTNALFAQCQGVLLEGARITRCKLQPNVDQEGSP